MDKIWLLQNDGGWDAGYYLLGAYSTMELAEAAREKYLSEQKEDRDIFERSVFIQETAVISQP